VNIIPVTIWNRWTILWVTKWQNNSINYKRSL